MAVISVMELHMAAAHFPIGLLLSSAFFDAAGAVARRPQLRETAYWTHLLGVVAAVVTVTLGLWGNPFQDSVGFLGNPFGHSGGEIGAMVVRHQWMGITSLVVFALLAVWRVRQRNDFGGPRLLAYAAVTMVGVLVVSVTGYLGSHITG